MYVEALHIVFRHRHGDVCNRWWWRWRWRWWWWWWPFDLVSCKWVSMFIRREWGTLWELRKFQNSSKGFNSTDNSQQLAVWMKEVPHHTWAMQFCFENLQFFYKKDMSICMAMIKFQGPFLCVSFQESCQPEAPPICHAVVLRVVLCIHRLRGLFNAWGWGLGWQVDNVVNM